MTKTTSIIIFLSMLVGIVVYLPTSVLGEAATDCSSISDTSAWANCLRNQVGIANTNSTTSNNTTNTSRVNGSPVKKTNTTQSVNPTKVNTKQNTKTNGSNSVNNIACTPTKQVPSTSPKLPTDSNATNVNDIPDASVITTRSMEDKPVFKFMSTDDGIPNASGNASGNSTPPVNTNRKTNTNTNSNSNVKNINKTTPKTSNTNKNTNSNKNNFSTWLKTWAKANPKNISNKNLKTIVNKTSTNGGTKALCITTQGKSSVYANANSSINPYKDRMKANCTFANVKLDGEGSEKYPMTGAEPPMTLSLIASRGVSVSNTNCYGYAVNSWGNVQDSIRKGLSTNSDGSYKPQPGFGNAFSIMDNFSWETVNSAVIRDGSKPISPNAKCPANHYKIFGYMTNANSSGEDYHWVLQNRPGLDGKVRFSHKPGTTAATDRDARGQTIRDPLKPGILHYSDFKYDFTQAYCVPCNLWIDPVNMATILKKPPTRK